MLRAAFAGGLIAAPLAAMAQSISGLEVPARAAVGEPLRITVSFDRRPSRCGLRVTLGDGSVRELRADRADLPITLSYTYSRAGDFTVWAEGGTYVRGLSSALGCRGSRSASVHVVDVAAERQAEERARAEREAQAAREREQREAAQREAAERQAAARASELEARERALNEHEDAVRRADERREHELAQRAQALQRLELEEAAREKSLQARERAARRAARAEAKPPQSSAGSSSAPNRSAGVAPRGTLDAF